MVAAPLMVMGLLKVNVLRLANKVVEAAMVIGAEAVPSAFAWLTFNVPLLSVMRRFGDT